MPKSTPPTSDNQLSIFDFNQNPFERIKHTDEHGQEYWLARELQPHLGYTEWRNFRKAIDRAITSCNTAGFDTGRHFVEANKTLESPNTAKREIEDFKLTRYACHLIAMNGDPSKKAIAEAQTYFAVKTRQAELAEQQGAKQIPTAQSKTYLQARHSGYSGDEAEIRARNRKVLKVEQLHVNDVRWSHGARGKDIAILNALDSKIATGKTPAEWKASRGVDDPLEYHTALELGILSVVKEEAAALHAQDESKGVPEMIDDVKSLADKAEFARRAYTKLFSNEPIELPAPKRKQGKLLRDGDQ